MKPFLLVTVAVLVAVPVALLFRYGTLQPCQMLAQDLAREAAAQGKITSPVAAVIARTTLDALAYTKSPTECVEGLWKLHSGETRRREERSECIQKKLSGREAYIRATIEGTPEWERAVEECRR